MARANTESFVTQVELRPTPRQAKKLRSKFEAARQVYNACLGESLRREGLMRQSRDWRAARKLDKAKKKDRQAAFRAAAVKYGFREYDLHKWATQFTHSWINEHIGSKTVEATCSLAFEAVEQFVYKGRRRPRFRRAGELRAVEGKAGSGCRWKGDRIVWRGVEAPARIDPADPVVQHGLAQPVKYVRMVRRVIRGRERYYCHLVCGGKPYRKPAHAPGQGTVGLDIGTQTIAIVGKDRASLEVFCAEVARDDRAIRRVQRAMDRSRRSNNPDNYKSDGTINRPAVGRLQWEDSSRYRQLRKKLGDSLRKEADHRRNLHGQLVAKVLQFGDHILMERLEYAGWAKKAKRNGNKRRKRFGKSVGRRAPGMFVSRLKVEAEKWGVQVEEFSTRKTRLSQVCHCGWSEKKPLHVRQHHCPECGVVAQRDLYSAYLARFVRKDTLQAGEAANAWPSSCAALEAAWSEIKHASGLPASLGLRARDRAACLRNGEQNKGKNVDVVPAGIPVRESHVEPAENRQDTPFIDRHLHPSRGQPSGSVIPGADDR